MKGSAGLRCSDYTSENGPKIGVGLSCGCSGELNLLPLLGEQPWIHFASEGASDPLMRTVCPGFPCHCRGTARFSSTRVLLLSLAAFNQSGQASLQPRVAGTAQESKVTAFTLRDQAQLGDMEEMKKTKEQKS